MNKQDLVDAIFVKAQFETKVKAEEVYDSILEGMTSELATGETVSIRGFGTFRVKTRAARLGRNFKTGESVEIPASKTVTFEPGTTLKDNVASGTSSFPQANFMASMEKALADVKKRMDEYRVRAGGMSKDHLDKASGMYEEARYKLSLLRNSSGSAWDEVRLGFEGAYQQLREAFAKAKEKF